MNYFEEQGRTLLANGYLIIPINPGHKRPALGHWQEARLGIHDLGNYPGHGVGILTGQGAYPICAVDIDCTDQSLSDRFAQWCKDNLGYTCERVGRAPKTLLVTALMPRVYIRQRARTTPTKKETNTAWRF